jgi:hypothetical protein
MGTEIRTNKKVKEWLFDPQNRLPVLLTCFLSLLVLFLVLFWNSPEGQRWLAQWQSYRHALQVQVQLAQALRYDPPMGTPLAHFIVKASKEFVVPSAPFLLLIVLGSCEGCGEKVVKDWAETLGNWETWRKENISGVLVLREGAEKVKKMVAEKGWQVTVIGDRKGKIAKALNACFLPRAYGFANSKLVWLQREPKMGVVGVLEEFLKVVKGEQGAAQVLNSWSAEMREKVWSKTVVGPTEGGVKR